MHDDNHDDESRFELYRADEREWFRLISRGQMLLRSNGESTRVQAVADVDRLLSASTSLRACMTASGLFYFTAQTVRGEVLATSRLFELPAERDAAMATAAKLLQGAPVAIVQT